MIARLREVEAQLGREEAPGIESLVEELKAGQQQGNEGVAEALAEVRSARLPQKLALLAAEVRG
jgi:hypothetical protein